MSQASWGVCTAFQEPLGPMGQCQYLGESRPGETERVNRFWTGNLASDLTMRSYFIRLTWGRGDKLSEEQASDVPQEPYEAWGRREGFRWGESQHCPKTERFAKNIWTTKCCRCGEVMLRARGDLDKLVRDAGGGKSGLRLRGEEKRGPGRTG